MSGPFTSPRGLGSGSLRGPILLCHVYSSCAFALVALPVLEATRASGLSHFPEPAQKLFSEGALWLLELIHQQQASLIASLGPGLWLFAVACCLGLVPEWWLLRAVVRQQTGAVKSAGPVLARLGGLGLCIGLLRLLVWLALAGLASPGPWLTRWVDERSADLLLLGGLAVTLLVQLGLSLLRDVAALAVVSGQRSALGALRLHGQRLLGRGARVSTRYGVVRALGFATWLGGELLLFALPSAATAWAGVGFAVHQLALLARVLLHAAWLGWLAHELEP